jgi:hypothetical protein
VCVRLRCGVVMALGFSELKVRPRPMDSGSEGEGGDIVEIIFPGVL